MISSKFFFAGAVLLVGVFLRGSFSSRLSVTMLDASKKAHINEFRALVQKDLPHDYMKEDAYLLRFLSAKDFDVKEAADYLRQNLAWRKAEKIDAILEEDFSDLQKRFPFETTSVTKDNRPVLYYKYGDWSINQAAGPQEVKRFVRYTSARMLEEMDKKAREMRKSPNDDTQFDIIINLEGYTLEKHGCMECLNLYKDIMQKSESQYSGAVNNVFFVNAPSVFESIYPMISAVFMEENTRQSIKVLGGRDSYEPVLLQHLEKEQFPKQLQ